MQVSAPDRDQLRALAELRLDRPVVLSLYLNLDPSQFATPPARKTRGPLAARRGRAPAPRAERALARGPCRPPGLPGARQRLPRERPARPTARTALAVFAARPRDLFEALKLPRAVPNRVAIGHSPLVGPLGPLARRERWCVTLVNRRDARILRGSPEASARSSRSTTTCSGQHDQGGWSQSRYQRGIEKEKDDHLKNTGDALMRHFKQQPFERLIVGGPREVVTDFEHKLHHYLQERLAGPDRGGRGALEPRPGAGGRPPADREARARARARGARAARRARRCGLEDVLPPLNERRVELLLLDEQFGGVTGVQCLDCGWLGLEGDRCPADGSELVQLDDLTEAMIELSRAAGCRAPARCATSARRSRRTAARPRCSGSKRRCPGTGQGTPFRKDRQCSRSCCSEPPRQVPSCGSQEPGHGEALRGALRGPGQGRRRLESRRAPDERRPRSA